MMKWYNDTSLHSSAVFPTLAPIPTPILPASRQLP